MKRLALSIFCLCLAAPAARAQNWPQFRGVGASGVAEGRPAPVKWDATKSAGVAWKTPIPGLGHSSPVVWGDKVFVTTAVTSAAKDETRYGLYAYDNSVKHERKHTRQISALEETSGME
jgi:hypothetical protein